MKKLTKQLLPRCQSSHSACKRAFTTQTQEVARSANVLPDKRALPGFKHLHLIQRVHPETGAHLHVVGILRSSNAEKDRVAGEIRELFHMLKPDAVVTQMCGQGYKAIATATGEEQMSLSPGALLDPRHIMNSCRASLHLITHASSGPRWNPYMYATQVAKTYESKVILGDIPFSALQYRNDLDRAPAEMSNYARNAPKAAKGSQQYTYPGVKELMFSTQSVPSIFEWAQKNSVKIVTQEKVVQERGRELLEQKGFGKSFMEDTAKSMAHYSFKAEGKDVLCLCNYLTMDLISEHYGRTTESEVNELWRTPSQSSQTMKICGSWVASWWNAWAAMMTTGAYFMGGTPEVLLAWGVGVPLLYPAVWAAASFRSRRRVQKFQQLLAEKRKSAGMRGQVA